MLITVPAGAETAIGRARVIDADTLVVDGKRVRGFDWDAPEWNQPCRRSDGRIWYPGPKASAWLRRFLANREVTCDLMTWDQRRNRWNGRCWVAGEEIGRRLVAAGWAVAYTRYSDRLVAEAATAKTRRLHMWRGHCDTPEKWRHR